MAKGKWPKFLKLTKNFNAQINGFHNPILVFETESDFVNNSYQWRSPLVPITRGPLPLIQIMITNIS